MPRLRSLILVLLAHGIATCVAAPATSPMPSRLLGRWNLDTSRLSMPPEARPRQVTIDFARADDGTLAMDVEIIDAAGNTLRTGGHFALDGTPAAAQGSTFEADVGAMVSPAPNVLVLGLGKDDHPASTRVYTADADGRSMIEVSSSTGENGKPRLRTSHFTRKP